MSGITSPVPRCYTPNDSIMNLITTGRAMAGLLDGQTDGLMDGQRDGHADRVKRRIDAQIEGSYFRI